MSEEWEPVVDIVIEGALNYLAGAVDHLVRDRGYSRERALAEIRGKVAESLEQRFDHWREIRDVMEVENIVYGPADADKRRDRRMFKEVYERIIKEGGSDVE